MNDQTEPTISDYKRVCKQLALAFSTWNLADSIFHEPEFTNLLDACCAIEELVSNLGECE
jgi:hypothetical protein